MKLNRTAVISFCSCYYPCQGCHIFASATLLCCFENGFSGRRRSCTVHNGIKTLPTLHNKIKSTPLSCVSRMHTASRRAPFTQHHSPWICNQCVSMSGSIYRQHGQESTATAAEIWREMEEQGRLYDVCGCGEDGESGRRLLSDELYTSRLKLGQSESLPRSCTQQQRTGIISPSRTVLLLGTD